MFVRTTLAALMLSACGESATQSPAGAIDASSTDGGATGSSGGGGDAGAPGDAGASDDAGNCRIDELDDPNYGASGGPRGCTQASDCTIRYTGDGCCPTEPQAMTTSAATLFDEGLNGIALLCGDRCHTVRCGPKPDASARCLDGGCSL